MKGTGEMIKTVLLEESNEYDYSVSEVFAMRQKWEENQVFDTMNFPKKNHALLYYSGCCGRYIFPDGGTLDVKRGDIVFLPKNSVYKTVFFKTDPCSAGTWLINFQLAGPDGGQFTFSDNVFCITNDATGYFFDIFKSVERAYNEPIMSFPHIKSLVYMMLSRLAECVRSEKLSNSAYEKIMPGILYLENDASQDKSIDEIADFCNVSATYFRRLFKEYRGCSPIEFRINRKIDRARLLLETGMLGVGEIAQELGFSDVSYFSRIFKKKTGINPSEYTGG